MHMHDDSRKTELARNLACVLASSYVVQTKLHGFHWNVKGKDFTEFHEFFGMLQEDIYGSIDGLAENILKLGYDAPGTLSEMIKLSCVDNETVHVGEPIDMVLQFLHDNEKLIDKIQVASDQAEVCREYGIMDFLAGREDMHKKWSWQARAISGLQPSRSIPESYNDVTIVEVVAAHPPLVTDDMPVSPAPCCASGCVCMPGACACPPECQCPCATRSPGGIVVAASADNTQEKRKTKMKNLPERKVMFSAETENKLQEILDTHNAKAATGRATSLAVLKAVYRRGANEAVAALGNATSIDEHATARVSAFVKLLRTGAPHAATYTADNDLLPAGHPRAAKNATALTASVAADKEMYMTLKQESEYETADEAILALAEYSGLGYETIPAFKGAWARAVRRGENPFSRAKNLSISLYKSKDADLLPRRKADTL